MSEVRVYLSLPNGNKTAVASSGLAVPECETAVLSDETAVAAKKPYGFSKKWYDFLKVVPLFCGNSYLVSVLAVYRTVSAVALNADS